MQITKNAVVTMDYKLTDPKGEVLDQSQPDQPLTYMHGTGNIIAGLESALEGKTAGDSVAVTVPPDQGYGHRDATLTETVDRELFKGVKRLEHGMRFRTTVQGQPRVVTVVGFEGTQKVKLDANHPLAGQTLHFDVKILEVRAATDEEIAHGHAHGPGGHHHH